MKLQLIFLGLVLLQEGIVRVKLAKILAGYDDVHYERSVATGENIKVVSSWLIDNFQVTFLFAYLGHRMTNVDDSYYF